MIWKTLLCFITNSPKCVIIFQLGEFEKNEITCCSLEKIIKLCFFERRPFVWSHVFRIKGSYRFHVCVKLQDQNLSDQVNRFWEITGEYKIYIVVIKWIVLSSSPMISFSSLELCRKVSVVYYVVCCSLRVCTILV